MAITIGKVGEAVKATNEFIQILSSLSSGLLNRSTIIQIDNKTKMTLVLVNQTDQHGGVQEPPPQEIPPNSAGVFSAQESAGSVATGTQGSVTYCGSGFDVTFHWNIPFFGSNEAVSTIQGNMGPGNIVPYSSSHQHGNGNVKVHTRFRLDANILDFATISEKNQALHAGGLSLGNPVGAETVNPDNVGRRQAYQFGVIYWSPSTTAHEVHGEILNKWTTLGRENYGYPTSDEKDAFGGKVSHFQKVFPNRGAFRGSIYWSPQTGTHAVQGAIREAWWREGGGFGRLGFPTSDKEDLLDPNTGFVIGKISRFQHGFISWTQATGIVEVSPP